jgi:hypothetical protein
VNKRTLKNEFFEIEYRTDVMRISGITPVGKSNLFVDLRDLPPVRTEYGEFYFQGGHRLWHAPEAMPRTYIPDSEVKVTELADGVRLESATEPGTGIRKQIEIQLQSDEPSVTLTHSLTNDGMWPVGLAPWAITQFRLGGRVILPMPIGNADPVGLLPNRQFALWPYSRINDSRLQLGDDFIVFDSNAQLPPFKFGYFNPHGWMGYWLDDTFFRKTFSAQKDVKYPDNNCNAEMYCNDQFVELESLGPLTTLLPGTSVNHVERWDILGDATSLPKNVQELVL